MLPAVFLGLGKKLEEIGLSQASSKGGPQPLLYQRVPRLRTEWKPTVSQE